MGRVRRFDVVDSHSGGAPSRLVLSGVPALSGGSVLEQMHDFAAEHDDLRRALVLEPRGRGLTSAVVLVPPTRPDADVGAFFMEAHGYLPMCGSDTISTVTVLLESGRLPITGDRTVVRLDTPAGLIEATAEVEDGRVRGVTFVGAPAFCLLPDVKLEVPGFGMVGLDVSYGGNVYAITDAAQFDLDLTPDSVGRAIELAAVLHRTVNDQLEVQHPTLPSVRGVTHVQLFNAPADETDPTGPAAATKVMVIMPRGLVDRSPCGTGTTAKVATLYGKGMLGLGEPFVHRSVTGASYTGRPVEAMTVGTVPGCRVAITGNAYVTAESTIHLDPDDVLAGGFQF